MGRTFGAMVLLAAVVIVGYSATNLFMAAYTASTEPYQQMLAGVGTAAVVGWEAGALMLIGRAWFIGYRPIAVGSVVLLVVAMAVSLIWEARIVIGGRADKFAVREVTANKLRGIEDDLTWLRKRRDGLTKRQDLDWIAERIEQREKDRDAATAMKDVMPEAKTAAQLMGGSEELWRAIMVALPLLFWMLARVLAVPLAMMAFAGHTERRTRAERPGAVIIPPQPVPAVIDAGNYGLKPQFDPPPLPPVRAPDPAPEAVLSDPETSQTVPGAGNNPPLQTPFVPRVVERSPPPKPRSKAERLEAVDAITRRWIAAHGVRKSVLGDGMAASDVYQDYVSFAGRSAIGNSHFGRSVKRCGFAIRKTATGAKYKLQIDGMREAVA